MSEHEQQSEQGPEEQEETGKDLDVPESEAEEVKGGQKVEIKLEET